MKFCLTLAAALLFALSAFAQAPLGFSYQAVIRGPSGTLITNKNIAVRISILQGSVTGTAVYVETHTPTTNASGLATFDIGSGAVVSGALNSLSWSRGPYFLKTEVDPDNTGVPPSYTISGTSKLLSVPYALYAGQAGHHIGELFGGGIIFYLWRDPAGVEHGLIASLDNLGNQSNPLGTIATNHTDGAINTAAAVASLGGAAANSAVGLCDAYSVGQFNDWYLPSSLELKLLYEESVALNAILDNDNNPTTNGLNAPGDSWWSSTRGSGTTTPGNIPLAFRLKTDVTDMFPGNLSLTAETSLKSVRAIRRF